MEEKCYFQIGLHICDKKSRLLPDATQIARRLIRACSFYASINQDFPDDITIVLSVLSSATRRNWSSTRTYGGLLETYIRH